MQLKFSYVQFFLDTVGVDELFVSNKDIKEVVEIYEKFYRTWTTIAERLFQNRQHHHYPSSKIENIDANQGLY